ncbi:hypothetical protein F4556_004943 [Kitasatospora gansuensis]|uniref:ATP-binding protein n=1 Tax=Kitasatospora gansuensis TaxID=258050 RepID=A0A7W7WJQ4_9ACTN|nr:ATP-binding protein [Kitasatospora gansuensis]MBB4949408.1 hypothetical protein [Kitasatospora gansuensis]
MEWLLGEPGEGEPLDLYPAEAGLLVLVPYLHAVQQLTSMAGALDVGPELLTVRAERDAARSSYESFLGGYQLLVHRAELRPEAAPVIGWWLFRRWLETDRGLGELVNAVAEPEQPLTAALDAGRLAKLLHGTRRGPDVCGPEHLARLAADDVLPGPGRQRVREQRLSLLLALAHGTALPLAALPDTIVEHTGIPYPVGPAELVRTLERASWGGHADLPVLRAECDHEAVVEALREYVDRLDELLHAVGRVVPERITKPMPQLPKRLSADGVLPREGVFSSGARFRLDDRRVRELLTGTQLYRNPDLAVRELYQNALDACRYRRARTEYLERTGRPVHPFEGRIDFTQGVDEDGRAYLECHDNGIGMGETELRGVFSHAGARFAEQPDFLLERAEWQRLDPPVELFPNSRFGIGVFSYFMLADEIRLTSCRMGLDGLPGPVVEARIFGPGHLFRIVQQPEPARETGTRVRLYLRGDAAEWRSWSAPDTLRQVLGIAEFATTVRRGEEVAKWVPGVLADTFRLERVEEMQFAFGPDGAESSAGANRTVVWPGGPEGTRVIWCERGGALLVDGLRVELGESSWALRHLRGAVVSLSGRHTPGRLSVDRSQVLDDLSEQLEVLLAEAVPVLVGAPDSFLTLEWMRKLAEASLYLADVVATAAAEQAAPSAAVEAVVGRLPADGKLLGEEGRAFDGTPYPLLLPDQFLLWRLMATGPHRLLDELTSLVAELADQGEVVTARPSDEQLIPLSHEPLVSENDLYVLAVLTRRSPRELALRCRLLGVRTGDPEVFPDEPGRVFAPAVKAAIERAHRAYRFPGGVLPWTFLVRQAGGIARAEERRESGGWLSEVPDEQDRRILCINCDSSGGFPIRFDQPVEPGHVVQASLRTGLSPAEVRRRLEAFRVTVEEFGFPVALDEEMLKWLSLGCTGHGPWLSLGRMLSPAQLLAAQREWRLPYDEVVDEYRRLGFLLPPVPTGPEQDDDLRLLSGTDQFGPIPADKVPGYGELFALAQGSGQSLAHVIERLAVYGIRVELRVPQYPTSLDDDLLADSSTPRLGANWHSGLTVGQTVPLFRVILVARGLAVPLDEVVARLRSYGIPLSHTELPEGLTEREALGLLSTKVEQLPTVFQPPMRLVQLLAIAQEVGRPLAETADLLQRLGVNVPDLASAVRAALARVPREPQPAD